MLRLTDVKLPLDHPENAIRSAILVKLGIASEDLLSHSIAKRSYDARKRSAIVLIYSIDVELCDEAAVLPQLADLVSHRCGTPVGEIGLSAGDARRRSR